MTGSLVSILGNRMIFSLRRVDDWSEEGTLGEAGESNIQFAAIGTTQTGEQ